MSPLLPVRQPKLFRNTLCTVSWLDSSFFQKTAYRFHRTFVGFLLRMLAVEGRPYSVQQKPDTGTVSLEPFSTNR